MSEADFYPAGAYKDQSAPYNEKEVPYRDFHLNAEYILQKKNVLVNSNAYVPEYEDETGHTYANTDDTNWEDVYNESHYTIQELLQELENYIKQDLERYKGSSTKERQLKEMLEDCQGWEVYDKTFEEA